MTEDKKEDMTMIPISKTTRERLKNIGIMRDTYDSIINKLIDKYEIEEV